MKEAYRQGFKEKIAPKYDTESNTFAVKPFADAQFALTKGQFIKKEREELFDKVFTEVLSNYFLRWLETAPHEHKLREYLYCCALAMGDFKTKAIQMETYGNNAEFLNKKGTQDDQQNG